MSGGEEGIRNGAVLAGLLFITMEPLERSNPLELGTWYLVLTYM